MVIELHKISVVDDRLEMRVLPVERSIQLLVDKSKRAGVLQQRSRFGCSPGLACGQCALSRVSYVASTYAKARARPEPLATISPVHWPFLVRD